MASLWAICTHRQTAMLSAGAVAGALGCDVELAAKILVDSDLGELAEGGLIRIKGTAGRIEWLGARREAGSKGGKKSQDQANAKQTPSKAQAKDSKRQANAEQAPSKIDPLSLSLSTEKRSTEPPPAPSVEFELRPPDEPPKPKAPKPGPASEHQRACDLWEAEYASRYGSKPTWGSKQGAIVARLLKRHGLAVFADRAKRLLRDPPPWVTGSVDIGFLEAQFDKLATPIRGPTKANADDAWLRDPRLARTEAELRKSGKPIPWIDDPIRKSMSTDRSGYALEEVSQ
jgi:hypothetical protein